MFSFREMIRMFHRSSLWMESSKTLLSELRKKTGYTFINCKKALEITNNDLAQAEKWLHEQALAMGWEKANKLADRPAFQGLIGIAATNKAAAIVEVNCETDFVAKNALFQSYVFNVAKACFSVAKEQTKFEGSISKLHLNASDMKSLKFQEQTLDDEAALLVSQVGEKISLRRALCINLSDDLLLASATHPSASSESANLITTMAGRFGALIMYKAENPSPETDHIAKQLCHHVIGMNPTKIGNVEEDKPKENKEEEHVFIHQTFIMDEEATVLQILAENGLSINEFVRYQYAEKLDTDENDNINLAQATA